MSERRTVRTEFSAEPGSGSSIVADTVGACLELALGVVGLGVEWLIGALSTSVEEVEMRLRSRISQTYVARLEEYRASRPTVTFGHPRASTTASLTARAAGALARAEATLEGLREQAPLIELAEHWQRPHLEAARQGLAQAANSYRQGEFHEALRLAKQTEGNLAAVAYEGCQRLGTAQRHIVSGVTARALEDMGYAVDLAAAGRATALWATKGQQTLAITVTGGGRVDLDMAGFDGLLCHRESERLLDELAARGLRVSREAHLVHGRREGGAMIVAAAGQARRTRVRPAQGLLHVTRSAFARSASASQKGEPVARQASERADLGACPFSYPEEL